MRRLALIALALVAIAGAAAPQQAHAAGSVDRALAKLRKHHDISKGRAASARKALAEKPAGDDPKGGKLLKK